MSAQSGFMRSAIALFVLMATGVTSSAARAAAPLIHTQVCGGIEYGIRAQREKVSVPGLTAPRLYYDGRDPDTDLDDTYLAWRGRNDVIASALATPAGHQFPPVAQQVGVVCLGDAPGILVRTLRWGDLESGSRRRDYEFADYDPDHILTPDPQLSESTGDGEWLHDGEHAILLQGRNPRGRGKNVLVVGEVFRFDVVVDPSLDVRLPEVEGFNPADPPRPVGVADFGDGNTSEYVLDELMVLVPDDATLQGILDRWGAQLIDRSPLTRDGTSTALIRFDPAVLATVDTSGLAEDMLLIEPDHRGTLALSSDRLAQLFALAAVEILEHGSVVAPNALLLAASIATGSTTEGPLGTEDADPLDAFQWSFMRDDVGLQSGVGRAWQVMDATIGFDSKVTLMVVDSGYASNFDLPDGTVVRKTEWGTPSLLKSSGGASIPWHGTDSATTAAGIVDNAYGTAGPAGPVADLVLVGVALDDYTTLRRVGDMVVEYRPEVVNMSFGARHGAFRQLIEVIKDVYFKEFNDLGSLLIASSGNDGWNVDVQSYGEETLTILPCESKYVVCVGGVTNQGTHAAGGSNYGTRQGDQTVEIHGPICTYGNADHTDIFNAAVKLVCGTSLSSPFVAGVAALVRSANPELTNTQVRDLLYATAHVGAPHVLPLPGGYDRRVNALDAVVAALGIELTPPAVTILDPDPGMQIAKDAAADVRAIAKDTFGRNLAVRWESDKDGVLTTTASGVFAPVFLSPGEHVISAIAADFRGVSTTKSVTVTVGFSAQVSILSPQPGAQFYVGNAVLLSASSLDPDTFSPLPDELIHWVVRDDGVDVWGGSGHQVSVSANVLTAGTYQVEVFAFDDDGTTSDTSSFTVLPIPPGESPPYAAILEPLDDVEVGAYNGTPVDVQFEGVGIDAEDGDLSGTRFRWTAISHLGTKKVLCVGTHVPGEGDGGIVLPQDCSSFITQLGLDQSETITTWLVTLEAFDSSGLIGVDYRKVTVKYYTG